MIAIEKPRIECADSLEDGSYGKFVVEPLERGSGTTLGNSLRRILLSSLPGTAVTTIKIDGVQHEFSTIPGVKEDVTEIVLNVKGIIAKLHSEGEKTVYIESSNPGLVTAGDIRCDSDVEILNPDHPICTLMPDAKFTMELTLNHGRGYALAERNKPAQPVIGLIPVDSLYTPVYKVNYVVENARVGDMTDYDRLTLEVWTDRTIAARDAVSLAAKILTDHLSLFVDLSDEIGSKTTVVEKSETTQDKVLEMTIEELDLSVRVAGGHGQGQAADLVGAAVQARAAGEEAVAIGDVDHIVLGAAGGHDGAGAAVLPQVYVVLGVEGHHAAAGGAGGGVDADTLGQGLGQQAVGIALPQVGLGDKGQLMQVLDAVDVVGGHALLVHLGAVIGDVIVDVADLLDQALALQSPQLVLGHGFDLRLIHGHENQS